MSTVEVKAKLDELNSFIHKYEQAVAAARIGFVDTIKDKSIPLSERWELFLKAPKELKRRDSWIVDLPTLSEACGGEVSWYDDFYAERHTTVEVADLIANIVDSFGYERAKQHVKFFEANPEKLDQLKEEILELNLDSFVYDW